MKFLKRTRHTFDTLVQHQPCASPRPFRIRHSAFLLPDVPPSRRKLIYSSLTRNATGYVTQNSSVPCVFLKLIMRTRGYVVKLLIRFSLNFLKRAVIDFARRARKQPLSSSADGAGGKLACGAFAA